MPLPERVITPVNISRGTLQCPVPDELEGVTNGTLANIIRQLSSLSRHAEEMFGNLFEDANNIANRSSNLQARIDQLAIRVTQLDSTVEEVSLQDIQLRKAYVSSQIFDQQVVSRESMPKAMLEAYIACDKPPPLDNLNPYRTDGKDGLKFYTDPNYFLNYGGKKMVKDTERMMNDRGKKHPSKVHINGGPVSNGQKGDKHKKRVRQPTSTMERQRLKAIGHGEYLMSPNSINNPDISSIGGYFNNQDTSFVRPNSIEIQRTYSSSSSNNTYNNYHSQRNDASSTTNSHYARNDVSASPSFVDGSSKYPHGHSKQQQVDQMEVPKYGYHDYKRQDSGGLLVTQLQKQQLQQQQQYQTDQIYGTRGTEELSPASSSPSKRRPTQPPPAPPPGVTPPSESTPIRSASKDNSSMPPPPPPMQQLIQEVTSVVQNGSVSSIINNVTSTTPKSSQISSEPDLPPPPPAPSSNQTPITAPELVIKASPKKEASIGGAPPPPPPPPPPPSNGLTNGDARKSSLPLNRPTQDNVRSDLLKAIRDGIALKKVEQKAACETSSEDGGGHIDVASILARRVAVEMSDSDEAQSDSECDSDDWGDESTA
ncbi:WASF [Lepeophtheirus salmonis]|uniref:Wiskott-Aldrich syndrome protein family member n=1 Tax=Lepeophtheirus salmonis TaxID=72036 RepID=A0A7R8CRL3_LEPSM|nr:WASF [Lepeophtheirus salmonis]CAF2869248.1 WASF [Lepeophtheirus salmonis]